MPRCLSCGEFSNCLTIDPCEHCGVKNWDESTVLKPDWLPPKPAWVPPKFNRSPASWTSKATDGITKATNFLLKAAGVLAGSAVVVYVLYLILASDQTKLSYEYDVPEDHVIAQPKPHGCDFDDAPLGNKHCHYEKHVDVERVCPQPDCRVTSVYVSWTKVDE